MLLFNLAQLHVGSQVEEEAAAAAPDENAAAQVIYVAASAQVSITAITSKTKGLHLPAGVKLTHPGAKFSTITLFNAVMAQGGREAVCSFAQLKSPS